MLQGASFVLESIPEDLQLKKLLWKEIDTLIATGDNDIILASTTSSILPSKLSEQLIHKENFVVAHPVSVPLLAHAANLGNLPNSLHAD